MATGEDDLGCWLQELGQQFQRLSTGQRNKTLDYLIEVSSASQLYHLSEKLHHLLKRDFLGLLPRELAFQLLNYLDPRTLLVCCRVSKQWDEVINECTHVWKEACRDAGVVVQEEDTQDAVYLKNMFLWARKRVGSLRRGKAFEELVLFGHTDRVMAIYYRDGKIATGSDDHTVRIWDCESGRCIKLLHTHTVADVKFDGVRVVTASFDTSAACWDWNTGEVLQFYQGHVAAVFSVDYSTTLDLLVTGSADSTVKIWRLSSGEILKTLPQHRSAWITHVSLDANNDEPHYFILSRDNVSIHQWQLQKANHDIQLMDEWQNPYNDLVPGLRVSKQRVSFATVNSDNMCHVGKASLCQLGKIQQHVSYSIPQDTYVQAFLGSGGHYDVLLTDGDRPSVDVIVQASHSRLAAVPLPPDYRPSKRGSTFTLGETRWLDGFDGDNDSGVFFATVQRDNSIHVLKWRNVGNVATDTRPKGAGAPS